MRIFFCYHENDTMSTDAADGIEKAGFDLQRFIIKENSQTISDLSLLKKIVEFKTDIFFTLNQFFIGDRIEFLSSLSILNIKIALWFIDNPFYFYGFINKIKEINNLYIFQWDKFYIDDLKKIGLQKVFYLPQATNPDRFLIDNVTEEEKKIFKTSVSYAANLDFYRTLKLAEKWTRHTNMENSIYFRLLEESVMKLMQNNRLKTFDIAEKILCSYDKAFKPEEIYIFAEAVEHRFSQLLRIEYINAISHIGVRIWGDKEEWKLANVNADLAGRVSYFHNIPKVYKYSEINLNISRFQQRTGTNQRVFDVPAGGNFVLSDYREELEEMFDLGNELIIFKDTEDLKKKLDIYKDSAKRQEIALRGQERVLSNHTYQHRMVLMIDLISSDAFFQPVDELIEKAIKNNLIQQFCRKHGFNIDVLKEFITERN